MLSFALNSWWSGELDSVAVKRLNIFIHVLTGFALFFFFRSLLLALGYGAGIPDNSRTAPTPSASIPDFKSAELLAGAAAIVWLAHPLHVSTVLYAVQRMAQLSTLFVFVGLWYFTAVRRRWAERGASLGELLASGLWLGLIGVLATLSKENGALLPAMILVVEVSVFKGLWAGRENSSLNRIAWALLIIPLIIIAVLALLWPEILQAGYDNRDFTLYERLLTQGRVLWIYLGWLLTPSLNSMGLFHDDIVISTSLLSPPWPLLAWSFWLLVLVIALILRQRIPLLFFAVLFFLAGQSMESSVLPLEMVFEHRNYLPSAGLMLFVVWSICVVFKRVDKPRFRLPVLALMYCVLIGLTFVRVSTWQDETRLAQVNAANHPESPRANALFANTLITLAESYDLQGNNLDKRGQWVWQARQHYEAIRQSDPGDFGSLVMIYQLDSRYLVSPVVGDAPLQQIKALIERRKVRASDRGALKVLMNCLAKEICPASPQAASEIVDLLTKRYPGSDYYPRLYYEYLSATQAPPDDKLDYLEAVYEQYPSAPALMVSLINEYGAREQYGAALDLARQYMFHDEKRRRLATLLDMFATRGSTAGGVTEPLANEGKNEVR